MTTVAAPDTSSRGCLSVAAGTTLQQLAALIPPCALTSTIRCRTDSSGFIVDTAYDAHPYDPSATVSSYSRPTTESGQRTPKPSQHAAILSPEPFAGLPIGHKGAFPVPTVSAPNRPNHDILLQTTESADRDPGPKSVARSRPPTSVTCQRITTRIRDALTSSARWKSVSTSPVAGRHAPPPPVNRPFRPVFPPARHFAAASAPYHQSHFLDPDRNAGFQQSVHRVRPAEGQFTPVPATESRLSPLSCQTQTAVHPLGMVDAFRFRRTRKDYPPRYTSEGSG